jgi:hypothetical protein
MYIRKIHYISGLCLTLFVGLHLFNHAWSILGAEKHIEIMNVLRKFYRHFLIESILLLAVAVQIVSGLQLFKTKRTTDFGFFNKLHLWSGLYLAFFLIIHVSAVMGGRYLLKLDTNFYFGVAGLNHFPLNLFFIPYYGLAIFSFFGHIASVHHKKMTHKVLGITPHTQVVIILLLGITITLLVFYGLTNHFRGMIIPAEYTILKLK